MATYDYKCTVCGEIHEEKHSMLQDPAISCPECGESCSKHISVVHIDNFWDGAGWEDIKFRK
jgi:putative FmdB family regulatory protein